MTEAEKYLDCCTLWVCEDCETFNDDLVESMRKHIGHHVTGIRADDYDEASRVAAARIVIARHIRAGTIATGSYWGEVNHARIHADWFSEEDSVYDA